MIDCEKENSWSWKYFKTQIGYKSVSFKWQRGTKLGEGSFGQVYTCVNIDNGKLLAMKEVLKQLFSIIHLMQILNKQNV